MAFKTVTDLSTDTMVSLGGFNKKLGKPNPTSVEGYYLGSRKVESKKAKTGFAFIYTLQTSKGNIGLWGKTDIDRKMEGVTTGSMIRVSFDKMVATPNGEMYKFKVEVDDTNSIEVASPANNQDEETEADQDFNASSEDQSEEQDYAAEEAAQQAALEAAERKAKVASLIKNKISTIRK